MPRNLTLEKAASVAIETIPKQKFVVALSGPEHPTLRKAQEVIYTSPKHGRITLVMRKAFNRMIQRAHEQGFSNEWYSVPISELARNVEWNSNDMRSLIDTIDKMQTTLIKWEEINAQGKPELNSVQLIGEIKFVGDYRADGRRVQTDLHYKIHHSVKEKVFNSKSMAVIDLDTQNRFKSSYTAALYELLMYVVAETEPDAEGVYYSVRMPWQEWRDLIMSSDASSYYDNAKYFTRDVLKKALAELHATLDHYEILAVTNPGRKLVDLAFSIRVKPQAPLPFDAVTPIIDTAALHAGMTECGLDEDRIQSLFETGDFELIEGTIEYVRNRLRNPELEPLTHPARYFLSAFQGEYCRAAKTEGAKVVKPAPAEKAPPRTAAKRSAAVLEKNSDSPMARGAAYYESLDPGVQVRLREEWAQHEASALQQQQYRKSGLKSMMVRVGFYEWLGAAQTAP